MSQTMTTYERFKRMFEHREADRVPIIDSPWGATIERWQAEGMPKGVSFIDFFDLDHVAGFSVDNSPGYESKVIEETDEYTIRTTGWGATLRSWKHATSTPEFLDFTIKDRESWAAAKARMTPSDDRIPWERLKDHYAGWREKGCWVEAGLWFGFDVTHAWAVGTERLLMAMVEDPEWCSDMFNHYLDVQLDLLDRVWEAGYTFDAVRWPDDMGYKYNQFFSLRTYRELLKPVHKRAIDWAHAHGIKAHLHSCGDINPFVALLTGG
jgi:uroporphyrinogen decarboxylase